MKINKAMWLPVMFALLLLVLSTSYPVLASLIFPEGNTQGSASSDLGPVKPDRTVVALGTIRLVVSPKRMLTLVLAPTKTKTPTPRFKPILPGVLTALAPTKTKTPTPKFRPILPGVLTVLAPTKTKTPTSTPTPTPTWTPEEPPPPAPCLPNADYMADVTVPDGTVFNPGTPFQKIWQVRNIGTCAWDPSHQLAFQLGDPLGAALVQPIPPAGPGQVVDIVVNMMAPATLGPFESHWRLRDANGQLFGPDLFAKIVVDQPAPPPAATLPPTIEPIIPALTVPAPSLSTEIDTSKFTSAREAFNLVWPTVWSWRKTAALYSAVCKPLSLQGGIQLFAPWQGPALGKCAEWEFNFLENPTAGPGSKQYKAVVSQSQVNTQQGGEQDLLGQVQSAGPDWIDSPDALQGYLQQGGADFLGRHPQGRVIVLSLRTGLDGMADWSMSTTSRPDNLPGSVWTASVDAASGKIDNAPVTTALPGKVYLSAYEAFAIALKTAQGWKPDAQPQQFRAQVNADEQGHAIGKASNWNFTFMSSAAKRGLTLEVIDGAASNVREIDVAPGEVIAGNWPDSPEALANLKTASDYLAFSTLYPQHSLIYVLLGNAQLGGNIWIAGAFGTNASVTANVTTPQ